jgi:hypothetical protein
MIHALDQPCDITAKVSDLYCQFWKLIEAIGKANRQHGLGNGCLDAKHRMAQGGIQFVSRICCGRRVNSLWPGSRMQKEVGAVAVEAGQQWN